MGGCPASLPGAASRGQDEFNLGRRNVFREDAADATAFVVDLEHDEGGRFEVTTEEVLQHHHDELHRREVVVEQHHLVHLGWLGARSLALEHHHTIVATAWLPGCLGRQ